ncbi:GRAM-domain-containing protein [Backusella circina FSU 941]|nr:GRAM-domain-containing protein [Backusella circina FSU 941]
MVSRIMLVDSNTSRPPPPPPPPAATERRGSINSVRMEEYCREFLNFGRQIRRQIEAEWNNNAITAPPLTREVLVNMTIPSTSSAAAVTPQVCVQVPKPPVSLLPPPPLPKRTMKEKKEQVEEPIKTESNPKKEVKMDVTFILADEKRNADFHQLFKSVPPDDHLVEDYNCAYYRDIMIQGRLYISQRHICFNSKFFNWVTNLIICFDHVIAVEKKTMALVVPNGVQITTETGKHVFASFMARDITFKQIEDVWKHSKLLIPEEEEPIEKEFLKEEQEEEMTIPPPKKPISVYPFTMIALKTTFYGSVEKLNNVLFKDNIFMEGILCDKIGYTSNVF